MINTDDEKISFLESVSLTCDTLGGIHSTSVMGRHWARIHQEVLNASMPKKKTLQGNLTSQWLAENAVSMTAMLTKYLSKKMHNSRKVSLIEDHIQAFFCRLVERDSLAPFLEQGKPIRASVIRFWAFQSVYSEMRGWGVDAGMRMFLNAKTLQDRKVESGQQAAKFKHHHAEPFVVTYNILDSSDPNRVWDTFDPNDKNVEEALIQRETYEETIRTLTYRISKTDSESGPHYRAILEGLVQGSNKAELAKEVGVTPDRLEGMLAHILRVMRRTNNRNRNELRD